MLDKGAQISDDLNYRYALWRIWDRNIKPVLFIGLNPSKADAERDDPTITRCIGFARQWEYGGLLMANVFAYRSSDPGLLDQIKDPQGPDNERYMKCLANQAGLVVAAWGNRGHKAFDAAELKKCCSWMRCLRVNKSGAPAHPLYVPNKTSLKLFPL